MLNLNFKQDEKLKLKNRVTRMMLKFDCVSAALAHFYIILSYLNF